MSNALEMFRQQREAVETLNSQVVRLGVAIAQARADLDALARHESLRSLLAEEQRWLQRTEDAVRAVRVWRTEDAQSYWSGVVKRWIVAGVFAWVSAAIAGATYARVVKPFADENAYLRLRHDFVESLERRMLQLTPAERRQLDTLLKGALPK